MKFKKSIVIPCIALLVIAGSVSIITARNQSHAHTIDSVTITKTSPQYQTVLPRGKTIDSLGGWKRVSPADSVPVFAYTDMIEKSAISVSEQPLPTSFKNDTTTKIVQLAKAYNATEKVDASGTSVYIGTSAKGPQSVIFTKQNLLILIKSEKQIDMTAWTNYVTSLI